MKLVNIPQFGPMMRFCDADVYWSLHVININGRISRCKLAEMVGVGEGSMRKILEYLRSWELVDINQTGVSINNAGLEFLDTIPIRVVDVDISEYVRGSMAQGILVMGKYSKITNGAHQRDIGIRVGAVGCTTFIVKDGRIIMAPDWDMDTKDPEAADKIRKAAEPQEGDVIIIGSADDKPSAVRAAVKAGLDMI